MDFGENDVRLVTGVAQLRDQEQALAAIEAAQDALEHEATALRDTGSDREASLRFALGELRIEASKPKPPNGITLQIRDLEERLEVAMALTKRLSEVDESIVKTAASRAEALAHLKVTYNELELVVNEVAGQHGDDAPLTERLTLVRQRVD